MAKKKSQEPTLKKKIISKFLKIIAQIIIGVINKTKDIVSS